MGVCPHALYEAVERDLSNAIVLAEACETSRKAMDLLKTNLLKKLRSPKVGDIDTRRVALDSFKDRLQRSEDYSPLGITHTKGFIRQLLGYLSADEVAAGMRYSSGSTVKMPMKSTSGYAKHNLGAVSSSSLEVYKEYMSLLRDYDKPGFHSALLREYRYGFLVDIPSTVTTVPKTNQTDRVIAVEPTANAFLQQGVRFSLEERLRSIGIDFAVQPDFNRHMARRGSLGHGLSTIDLSAASDYLSTALLKDLLPCDWFDYIMFVSGSSFLLDNQLYDHDRIPLTMGNAITFPLQTIIFLAICYEVYRRHDRQFLINKNVAVFGDDIIVCDDLYSEVVTELGRYCLHVNVDKSFGPGDSFRESCGADWYNGHNIRSVYIKRLCSIQDHYIARNLLAAWSYRHQIELPETLCIIDRFLISKRALEYVPPSCPIDSGIRLLDPLEGSYDRCTSMHRFKQRRVVFKKRSLSRFHSHFSAVAQAALAGYLTNNTLAERPLGPGKVITEYGYSSFWSASHICDSDKWLYDVTTTSSGNLPAFCWD